MAAAISTARRLAYAAGYAQLQLITEAKAELAQIPEADQALLEVRLAWLEWHLAASKWRPSVRLATALNASHPHLERPWLVRAYAQRELGAIADARTTLLTAEREHGAGSALLHYNLACYEALLGHPAQAEERLQRAFALAPDFRAEACDDPDLASLTSVLRRLSAS